MDVRDETACRASGIRQTRRGRPWTLTVVGLAVAIVVGPGAETASAGNPAAVGDPAAIGSAGNPAVGSAGTVAVGGVAERVRVLRDIPYAPADPAGSRGHLLDLYLPRPSGHALRPLAIWTGGSAWLADTGKESAGAVAPPLLARGYAVAGVSIRSSSQAIFPAQVHDIKAAIRWLRANARRYGIDARRIAIMGDSSGGWTTAMAALTGDVRALEGSVGTIGVSSRVQAAVAFYPPTDFLQMDEQMLPGACADFNALLGITDCHDDPRSPESRLVGCAIQSCPRTVARANPISYVSRGDPPMMILHGQADRLVPHGQSILLYNALRARCMDATFFSVPGAGHDWRQVIDPANHTSHTVYRTRACRERVTVGSPDPTWDTIVDFIDRALGVRRR